MRLTLKFALITLIPILALVASYWFASQALEKLAKRQVEQEAKLVMRAAKAARDYTAKEIKPLIKTLTSKTSGAELRQATPSEKREFIKPSVPAYAARRVLDLMLKGDPEFRDYEYKEASNEPTIESDKANDDEKDLIDEFSHQVTSDSGTIFKPLTRRGKDVLSFSQRMVAEETCMSCHSTKEAARSPEFIRENGDMIAAYGGEEKIGGFGWIKDSVVAAQVVYVPKEKPREIASNAIWNIGLVLLGSGLLMVSSLWLVVNQLVLRPVARLSHMAEQISQGRLSPTELPVTGKDEIAELTAAFNRMNRSLYKAVKRLKSE
jgi:protein-histidine pros-kinase